mgnify:CR=1 FL=1
MQYFIKQGITLALAGLGFLSVQAQLPAPTVTELAPLPMAISNNAVTGNGSYVYSFGGIDSTKKYSGITRKAFRYDIQNDSWDTLPPLPDTLGKIASAASFINGKIYITGGYHVFANGSEKSSNKVHIFDVATQQYLPDGAPIPVPIDDHVQVTYRDSLLYLITGWSNTSNSNAVQIYNPALNQWSTGTAVPANNNYRSFGASGVQHQGKIYYFGGSTSGFRFNIQNNLRIGTINLADPTQISWTDTVIDPAVVGYRMAAALNARGEPMWIGGSNQNYNFDGLAFSNGRGVPPNNRILTLSNVQWQAQTTRDTTALPMDLRGIAPEPHLGYRQGTYYLAGGMEASQKVSRKTLRLQFSRISLSENETAAFKLFPNPTSQNLQWQCSCSQKLKITLYSLAGVKVMEQAGLSANGRLSIAHLPQGVYLLQVEGAHHTSHHKVQVRR